MRDRLIITPAELQSLLDDGTAPVVLDVRWRMGEPAGDGRARFEASHIPGAIHADIDTVFSRHPTDPTQGRHPLPEPSDLAADLAALGITGDTRVVVVDEPGSFAAERAWWVLGWIGVEASVLDGGFPAWQAAGLPVTSGSANPVPAAPFSATAGHRATVTADEAAAIGQDPSQSLIDVRSPERYRGETEPIDPVAGHIPGARNIPVLQLYTDDGTLPSDEELRAILHPQDHPAPTIYCGSGISAAREVLAFAALGVEAALFPGSWSAWCNDPVRPIATGQE